ncbi:5-formyltetrahydrofolate cyclo-ligase [Leucobacter sp. UT-8R-CII-1-4]|uniref:5-formyltetrahydrofolate cyclo-ligase n=1 Tax=Leucobacter sp. UT-8R-CII-1-4 TaxID=3040075 RepID=UPI0024A893E4|nr:5-formyltetrahydrofolate cyclo-ligase [Leucobacter sp. UT-8R-CII-1-4]MDI6023831.1 5-formyltetrahydrofolate cyclo-ligase [Leucobacter sp. UT-8R-CII-1-4]
MTETAERKRELRAVIRASRNARAQDRRSSAAAELCAQLKALVLALDARTISCFLATATEPDTRPFLRWARAQGIEVLLPVSRQDGELDWIRSLDEMTVLGAFDIEEPVGEVLPARSIEQVDLMLIPAAAVDQHGNRLGWGRGYFDRCFSAMTTVPPVWAVVFDDEVLPSVPVEPHDSPVHGAVTPSRTLSF